MGRLAVRWLYLQPSLLGCVGSSSSVHIVVHALGEYNVHVHVRVRIHVG